MALIFCAIEIIAGLMPTYWAYAAVLPVMGLATLLTLTAANASIQMEVAPAVAGPGDGALHDVVAGRYADRCADPRLDREIFGPRWTLIGGGAAAAAGVLISALVIARRVEKRSI